MKRSRVMHVSGLMATVGFTMAACDTPQVAPPEAAAPLAYTSVEACKTDGKVSAQECETSFAKAQADAAANGPRYATKEECEGQWGPEQCQQNNNSSGGGSFFGPMMMGYFIGSMMNNGGGPMYRDRNGGYVGGNSSGTSVSTRDNTDVVKKAPARAQSRTSVVSRGGFGGGGRGYGG